jgi:hypothetical protein
MKERMAFSRGLADTAAFHFSTTLTELPWAKLRTSLVESLVELFSVSSVASARYTIANVPHKRSWIVLAAFIRGMFLERPRKAQIL